MILINVLTNLCHAIWEEGIIFWTGRVDDAKDIIYSVYCAE